MDNIFGEDVSDEEVTLAAATSCVPRCHSQLFGVICQEMDAVPIKDNWLDQFEMEARGFWG